MASNLSWQQIAVFALCLIAAFAAHRFLGLAAGEAAGVVTAIVAFLMGRQPPNAPAAVSATATTTPEGATTITVAGDVQTPKDGAQ